MNIHKLRLVITGALAALCMAVVPAVHAQSYRVTVDTSGFTPGDTFGADFQLNQGDPSNPVSTVSLSQFSPGTGSPGAVLTSVGATGSLASDVNLTTLSNPYAEFTQDFTPGGTFSFLVDASQLSIPSNASVTPDEFLFDVYDETLTGTPNVSTTDPSGLDIFASVTKNSLGVPSASSFSYYSYAGGLVGVNVSAAPEGSTLALFGSALLAFAGIVFYRRKAAVVVHSATQ